MPVNRSQKDGGAFYFVQNEIQGAPGGIINTNNEI